MNGVDTFKCIHLRCRKLQNAIELFARDLIFSQQLLVFYFDVTFIS